MKFLDKIPGYNAVVKAFMTLWGDKNLRLAMISSKLRVNEHQFPEYHKMLTAICKKLGIEEIPEFYIENYPHPNAYTIGEKKPMIVLTTALIESIPTELIPTVLARECGHIICGHVKLSTITYLALWKGLISTLSTTVSPVLEIGFYNWLKASEYSADRVAAVCDGTSDKLTELYIYYAGYSKKFPFKPNKEEFLRQGKEYELADKEGKNKTFEDLNRKRKDHPFCAARAYICHEWAASEAFVRICKYVEEESNGITDHQFIPLPLSYKDFQDETFDTVAQKFRDAGFSNIERTVIVAKDMSDKAYMTAGVKIGSGWEFQAGELVDKDTVCLVSCYGSEADARTNDLITIPHNNSYYAGKSKEEAIALFTELGFSSLTSVPKTEKKKKQKNEPGTVVSVMKTA